MDSDIRQAIRDLISHHPLNPQLVKDQSSWNQLCQGLDHLDDADSPAGRLVALNAARSALGMDVVDARGADTAADVTGGLASMRVVLVQRVNAFRERHSEPLSALFHSSLSYQLEKAAAAVGSVLPGAYGGGVAYDRVMGIDALSDTFGRLLGELREREYDDGACWAPERALYVLERATALLDGEPGIEARDVDVMVSDALPVLAEKARQDAIEIDETTAQREEA